MPCVCVKQTPSSQSDTGVCPGVSVRLTLEPSLPGTTQVDVKFGECGHFSSFVCEYQETLGKNSPWTTGCEGGECPTGMDAKEIPSECRIPVWKTVYRVTEGTNVSEKALRIYETQF